ncbi:MAG: hypothetical protein R8N23_09085 [Reichenbachiella sp.]|uniref:hypothetical protein n=1 Tax=Reichenbachiella sp. TaxID=2184521 RepID=UPI0029669EA4|nr:hypothetical protein [Reichenbachiella sp.]MDW3210009.1 hypothetical protein [Reichenbachiella sp.]
MDELHFNRQYLLCDEPVSILMGWNQKVVGHSLTLYVHPNLDLNQVIMEDRKLTLVGDFFDPHHPNKSNKEILQGLSNETSFDEVLKATFELAGKFVLIYDDSDDFKLFHDAVGLREVFYWKGQPNTPCASQPTLFDQYKKLEPTSDVLGSAFYSSPLFAERKERISNTTQYEGLEHLQPNHYLDLRSGRAVRYFPNEPLDKVEIEAAVNKSAFYLRGFFKAMVRRYPLMIAVTAGMDSRIMLAASREVSQDVFYFIFQSEDMESNDLDISTPTRLMEKLGLPFHVISDGREASKEEKEIMLKNVELMYARHSEFRYETLVNRSNHLNITSVSEFSRNYYHYEADPKNLSGNKLATLSKFKSNPFVSKVYAQWLAESREFFDQNGYNTLDMFYWEEKMGNWLANGRSSLGNVIEDFSPFNCRNLMINFLAVDEKYRGRFNSTFHRKLIEKLCPEALQEPINGSRKYQIINALVKLGIYPIYKKIQLLLKS